MKKPKWVVHDGLTMRVGSPLYKLWARWAQAVRRAKAAAKAKRHKKPPLASKRRNEIIIEAHKLLGIHEVPAHSNDGPAVHMIQSATGAYRAPWCVSTVQYIWKNVLGSTWADGTAGAYYLADYAARHGAAISKPMPGCAVVYHIGQGHAGTVVNVNRLTGTFMAIEGNEGDAVRLVRRDPRRIRCTFILRPELR